MSTTHCEDYIFDEVKVGKVIQLFVEDFARQFDLKELEVWSMLNGLHIEVSVIPRVVTLAYDVSGKLVKDAPVSGLALSPSRIWVEVMTNQIWATSLTHELVHIVIWQQNGGVHGDPDHEGKEFSGWSKEHTRFIKRFNKSLFEMDI